MNDLLVQCSNQLSKLKNIPSYLPSLPASTFRGRNLYILSFVALAGGCLVAYCLAKRCFKQTTDQHLPVKKNLKKESIDEIKKETPKTPIVEEKKHEKEVKKEPEPIPKKEKKADEIGKNLLLKLEETQEEKPQPHTLLMNFNKGLLENNWKPFYEHWSAAEQSEKPRCFQEWCERGRKGIPLQAEILLESHILYAMESRIKNNFIDLEDEAKLQTLDLGMAEIAQAMQKCSPNLSKIYVETMFDQHLANEQFQKALNLAQAMSDSLPAVSSYAAYYGVTIPPNVGEWDVKHLESLKTTRDQWVNAQYSRWDRLLPWLLTADKDQKDRLIQRMLGISGPSGDPTPRFAPNDWLKVPTDIVFALFPIEKIPTLLTLNSIYFKQSVLLSVLNQRLVKAPERIREFERFLDFHSTLSWQPSWRNELKNRPFSYLTLSKGLDALGEARASLQEDVHLILTGGKLIENLELPTYLEDFAPADLLKLLSKHGKQWLVDARRDQFLILFANYQVDWAEKHEKIASKLKCLGFTDEELNTNANRFKYALGLEIVESIKSGQGWEKIRRTIRKNAVMASETNLSILKLVKQIPFVELVYLVEDGLLTDAYGENALLKAYREEVQKCSTLKAALQVGKAKARAQYVPIEDGQITSEVISNRAYALGLNGLGVNSNGGDFGEQYNNRLEEYRDVCLKGDGDEISGEQGHRRFMYRGFSDCQKWVNEIFDQKNLTFDSSWKEQLDAVVSVTREKDEAIPLATYELWIGGRRVTALQFKVPVNVKQGQRDLDIDWRAFLTYKKNNHLGMHLYFDLGGQSPEVDGPNFGLEVKKGRAIDQSLSWNSLMGNGVQHFTLNEAEFMAKIGGNNFHWQLASVLDNKPVEYKHRLSENLNVPQDQINEVVAQAVRDTSELFFEGKRELKWEEEYIFDEIASVFFTLRLIEISGATSFNLTTLSKKDNVNTNSILFYMLMMMTGKADDEKMRFEHAVITHIPALMGQTRQVPTAFVRIMKLLRPEDVEQRRLLNEKFQDLAPRYFVNGSPEVLS